MISLRGFSCPIRFHELSEYTLLCQFINAQEKFQVPFGAPWHFDCALVLLEEVHGTVLPHKVTIVKSTFWIQIHNAPLQCMNKNVVTAIGE